jgi:hypothetical protein
MRWLLDYGEEAFDGHDGVVRYFTSRSIRQPEREVGQAPLKRLSEYLRCYLVQCSQDGNLLTVGKRHRGQADLPSLDDFFSGHWRSPSLHTSGEY